MLERLLSFNIFIISVQYFIKRKNSMFLMKINLHSSLFRVSTVLLVFLLGLQETVIGKNKKDGYRQLKVRQLGSLRPWDHRGKCYMNRKRIRCLSNASQHVPIYLQPCLRYSGISVASEWFSTVYS